MCGQQHPRLRKSYQDLCPNVKVAGERKGGRGRYEQDKDLRLALKTSRACET